MRDSSRNAISSPFPVPPLLVDLVIEFTQESQCDETGLLQNASLVNQKKLISGSCRCVCRKLLVGRRICNDVTCGTPSWVLLVGSLGKTELLGLEILRQSFPQEARVTPVELSIDSAIGLLPNLETAQQERSVLLLDEQNLLVKEEKEGCAQSTKMDFYELLTKPNMKPSSQAQLLFGHKESLCPNNLYV